MDTRLVQEARAIFSTNTIQTETKQLGHPRFPAL